MKAIIELSIEAEDGQTWMVLETDIPVRLHGGERIAVCGCCDPLEIDAESSAPVWLVAQQLMRYTCWREATDFKLNDEVEHFIRCGFVERKQSREMFMPDGMGKKARTGSPVLDELEKMETA